MITLTTPPQVKGTLGGATSITYDKFVLSTITYDTVNMTVNAQVRITSTSAPDMQPITGRLVVTLATGKVEIEVQQLDFYRRLSLTGPQSTSLETQIRNAQNALETGLISLGVVDGSQAAGA